MSRATDIADAVTAELNACDWGQEFTAVRLYHPVRDLSEMNALKVTVVPSSLDMELVGRNAVQSDYPIDVAVQKKYNAETSAEIDPLMTLVEEIADHFLAKRLDSPDAICIHATNDPIYSHEHMEELRQFTSVVSLTFRML